VLAKNRFEKVLVPVGAPLRTAMEVIDVSGLEIAMVVDQHRRLKGVLTDGDIRRALLGGAELTDSVDPHVQSRFTSVRSSTGRNEVLDIMRARSFSQIPVVDDEGRVIGLHLLKEMIGNVDRPNWAIIMAGGRGERLRPITDSIPKPMVQVAGRPILERIVLHLVGFGITRIFLAVNYMSDVIQDHFADGSRHGCRIEYLQEDFSLGTGGALSLLAERPVDALLVLNGDILTQVDVGSMLDFHRDGGYKATIGLRDYSYKVPYGVVEVDRDRVVDIREKPSHVWSANCGIYVIQPDLVSRVPRGEYFRMPDLMGDCLKRGEPVGGYPVEGDWMDIGRPGELQRARGEDVAP
jgi:dTDP-glucose pyrophosphorylase